MLHLYSGEETPQKYFRQSRTQSPCAVRCARAGRLTRTGHGARGHEARRRRGECGVSRAQSPRSCTAHPALGRISAKEEPRPWPSPWPPPARAAKRPPRHHGGSLGPLRRLSSDCVPMRQKLNAQQHFPQKIDSHNLQLKKHTQLSSHRHRWSI